MMNKLALIIVLLLLLPGYSTSQSQVPKEKKTPTTGTQLPVIVTKSFVHFLADPSASEDQKEAVIKYLQKKADKLQLHEFLTATPVTKRKLRQPNRLAGQ